LGLLFFTKLYTGAGAEAGRLFFGIGLLGAFTTMSTFSVETMGLLEEGKSILAGINVLSNVSLSLIAVLAARTLVVLLR
jgi:fluoride exporter